MPSPEFEPEVVSKVEPKFEPGFRFSATDCVFLIVTMIGTTAVGTYDLWIAVAMANAITHFFLFCNIFRIRRKKEFLWVGIFVIAIIYAALSYINWPVAIITSCLPTPVLIAAEMRHPSYHGIFWKQVNPALPAWWKENATTAS